MNYINMKKISFILAALMALLAFSSCNESKDDHPVLSPITGSPVVDFLNNPEGQKLLVLLTQENKTGHVHMTCSQPTQYGAALSVRYEVEVSLNEDFTAVAANAPAYMVLPTAFYNCSEINPVNDEIAAAMEEMMGITEDIPENWPTEARPVYFRLSANVQTAGGEIVPDTHIVSNVVKLESVSVNYFARVIPDLPTGIFVRGDMNGWGAEPAWEFLTTTKANVYTLQGVSIAKGTGFKIADSSWGSINCGAKGNLEFNKRYSLDNAGSSGNITMPEDFNGNITLYQSGDNFSVIFEPVE